MRENDDQFPGPVTVVRARNNQDTFVFTEEQKVWIMNNRGKYTIRDMADMIGVSATTLRNAIEPLMPVSPKEWRSEPDTPFPGKISRTYHCRSKWVVLTEEQLAWLKRWSPVRSPTRLARMMGISTNCVRALCERYGVERMASYYGTLGFKVATSIPEPEEPEESVEDEDEEPVMLCSANCFLYGKYSLENNSFAQCKGKAGKPCIGLF